MPDKIEKYIAWLGGIAIAVLLFIVTRNSYLNSDDAFYSLMGQGIALGNLLLTDWVSSTIPHYFPYGIIEGFWAIFFSHDLRTAHALTIVSLTMIFFALIWIIIRALLDKEKVKDIVIALVVLSAAAIFINTNSIDRLTLLDGSTIRINTTGKDGLNGISDLYAHLSVVLLMLPVIYLYYLRKQFDLFSKITIVILLLCHGSRYNYVYFVIPFIIENIFYFIRGKQFDKRFPWVILGLFVSYLFRLVLTSSELGLSIPGGDSLGYLRPYEHIGQRFSTNFFYLAIPFSAVPWGQYITNVLPQFIFFGIFLVALYSFFAELKRVSKLNCIKLPEDRFITFLLISAICIFLLQVFIYTAPTPARLSGSVVSLYILLIYFVCKTSLAKQAVTAMCIFVMVFILSITNLYMQNRFNISPSLKERMELIKLIECENLHYGYAWFGNANATNYAANKQIIADLLNYFRLDYEKATVPRRRLWLLDKTVFTRRPVDFIIIWKGERGRWQWQSEMESPERVKENFGDPAKILETENLWLYIYSYDLYEKMQEIADFPPKLVRDVKTCREACFRF